MNRIRMSVVVAACVLQAVVQASGPVAPASAERPGLRVSSVRESWPIAREPGGQWGVVGEVMARHGLSRPVDIHEVGVALFDGLGRELSRERYATPEALADMLRIATAEGEAERWRPIGTTAFTAAERAIAFVAVLTPTRPAWAVVSLTADSNTRQQIVVPLEVQDGPALLWPTSPGSEPWVATSTAGTPGHWQGGAIVDAGRLSISQRFALDLRQIDEQFQTHPVGATSKEAYYAWGEDVRSMGRGRVIDVVTDDPDYEIGDAIPPTQHPAGNYVVVQHGVRAFGVYAHLQRGTARVRVGDWVERGQPLAQVGNSGASSEPHLHVHVADSWRSDAGSTAAFFLSQGVPALFWGAQVLRDGTWVPLRGTTPTEFDIIVPSPRQ